MSTRVLKSCLKKGVVGISIFLVAPHAVWADKTDNIVNNNVSRNKASAASQQRIDNLSENTEKTVAQYHQERKSVDVLKMFNDRMRRTIKAQEEAMIKLERSIEDASLIERQIVPLMLRMISSLDKFIAADLPFKVAERRARLDRIRGYLTNANISAAERFRQVLEAYSIENDYGKTVDVYQEELALPEGKLNVNVLQVGRSGLYYQTTDGKKSGYWDKSQNQWVALDASYNQGIADSIRVAQGKVSPDLMKLPVIAPEKI